MKVRCIHCGNEQWIFRPPGDGEDLLCMECSQPLDRDLGGSMKENLRFGIGAMLGRDVADELIARAEEKT